MSYEVADGGRTLLQLALRGDRAAMASLYLTYRPGVVRFLRHRDRRLGESDIDDLVQTTFLVLMPRPGRSLRDYDGRCGALTYLCAVAWRVHARHRRRRRQACRSLESVTFGLHDPSAGPSLRAEQRETLRCVARAASRLSLPQRQALLESLQPCRQRRASDVTRRRLCDARRNLRRIVAL